MLVVPVVVRLDDIEKLVSGKDQGAVFLNIGELPDLEIIVADIEVVIDVGDGKLGLSRSETFAVGDREGEVDITNKVF